MSPSPASSAANSLSRDTGVNGTVNGRAASAKVLLTHSSNSCAPFSRGAVDGALVLEEQGVAVGNDEANERRSSIASKSPVNRPRTASAGRCASTLAAQAQLGGLGTNRAALQARSGRSLRSGSGGTSSLFLPPSARWRGEKRQSLYIFTSLLLNLPNATVGDSVSRGGASQSSTASRTYVSRLQPL